MMICIEDFIAGAREARGVVVVIDVFRAFSVAAYCFMAGAERILAAGEVDHAWELKRRYPDALLVGERGGKKLAGFDFGNSPSEIRRAELAGRTLIQTTHAGTQGIVNAVHADEVLTGAFVNARATAEHILARRPQRVTLVRMGLEARTVSDEDALCAMYLAGLLKGREHDGAAICGLLEDSPFSERFFDPAKPWNPQEDFHLCLRFASYGRAIRAARNAAGDIELRPADPGRELQS